MQLAFSWDREFFLFLLIYFFVLFIFLVVWGGWGREKRSCWKRFNVALNFPLHSHSLLSFFLSFPPSLSFFLLLLLLLQLQLVLFPVFIFVF